MLKVVKFKSDWKGSPYRQVADNAQDSVGHWPAVAKREVVGKLVDTCSKMWTILRVQIY